MSRADLHIMIVAGEASGDQHGAELVNEIKKIRPGVSFSGMGSKALQAEGVSILYDAAKLAVVGIIEVIAHITDIRAARKVLVDELENQRPDLLILIDFPDFNLSLAKKAKAIGVPIFYYISPQVWAWRSGRVQKIAALVDKIAVILPFEKDFYKKHGVNVDFVGHPLLDQVKTTIPPEAFRRSHSIAEKDVVVGLLPGSRIKEVKTILPIFLEAAKLLRQSNREVTFLLPLAPTLEIENLDCPELSDGQLPIKIVRENRYDLMNCCDLVMAASGTVTLELAILGTPMVVSYKISPLTYLIGRRLIKVEYASLVNLIADAEVVRELIQHDFTAENVRDALLDIWPDTEKHIGQREKLEKVSSLLGSPGASYRAAELALQLVR